MVSAIPVKQLSKYTPQLLQRINRRRLLKSAIQQAYRQLSQRYPEWTDPQKDALFDNWFLTHRAAPLLDRYVTGSTPPTAMELAIAWDQQLGGSDAKRRRRQAAIMPAIIEFLHLLEKALSIE